MKALVVYHSQTGNTKIIAEEIAEGLKERGVEVKLASIKPREEKDYETNVEEAKGGVKARIEPTETDLSGYKLVCIGSPVWSSAPSTPVNGYLAGCRGADGKEIVCFATHGGGGPGDSLEIMRRELEERGGKVIDTIAFPSSEISTEGGKERARQIGRKLGERQSAKVNPSARR